MSDKKFQKFKVPGLFHPLMVSLVPSLWLAKFLGKKRPNYYGAYDSDTKEIFIVQYLGYHVKRHTLYHEIAHHVLEELRDIKDEENQCDVLATFFEKLIDSSKNTDKNLLDGG